MKPLILPFLHAAPECAAALVPWRVPAGPRLTVVAKIAFAMVEGEVSSLLPGPAVTPRDVHIERSPLRSLEAVSDLAPALPRAEVVVVGSAFVAQGLAAPALTVQLQIARGDVLLKKRLFALGDRKKHGDRPATFQAMPIRWEHALRTVDNPIGIAPESGAPNWMDPDRADVAAGLGPIPAAWPLRRRRRGSVRAATIDAESPDLPADFDWTYHQAAPEDQRLERLVGDEWIALDGLHPVLPRLSFRLPRRRFAARLVDPTGRVLQQRDLAPDRLTIDTDRQVAKLTCRGVMAADWSFLAGYRVEVGGAVLGGEVVFPDASDPSTARVASPERTEEAITALGDETASVDFARPPKKPTTPFRRGERAVLPPKRPEAPDSGPKAALTVPSPADASARPALPFGVDRSPDAKRAPTHPAPELPPPDKLVVPHLPRPGELTPLRGLPAPDKLTPMKGLPPPDELAVRGGFPPPDRVVGPSGLDAARPTDGPPSPMQVALPASGPPQMHTRPVDPSMVLGDRLPFQHDESIQSRPRTSGSLEGLPFAEETRVETPPAAPPRSRDQRRGEMIPVRTDGPVATAALTFPLTPPEEKLIIVAKVSFVLTEGQVAPLALRPDAPCGDVYAGDDLDGALVHASDFALAKAKVDLLVRGHAYAPGGKAAACEAAIRLRGATLRYERVIAVLGDRTWQPSIVTESASPPAPFEKIPLVWERAFGGRDVRDNPSGVGHRSAQVKDGLRRMPNFEIPSRLLASPDDRPPPAALGPIHPLWPVRWSLLGTYGAAWAKARWPALAEDFDPTFFQSAPAAQRLDVLDGDEEYELVALHPQRNKASGKLPGVRARAFARRTDVAGGGMVEIPLKLDTLTFEPDRDLGHLVFRGQLTVSDDDAPELRELFVTLEPTRGPRVSLAEATARYEAAIAADRADDPASPSPSPPGPPPEPSAEELESARRAAAFEKQIADHEARVRKEAGDPPEDVSGPLPPPDPAAVGAALRAAGAAEDVVAEVEAALRPHPVTEPPPPPPLDLRAFVIECMARGEPLAKLDLAGADLSELDLKGQDLTGSNLSRAKLDGADLAGANLTGARLTRAALVGAKLVGARLALANVDGAVFRDADLTKASLAGAEGVGVVFAGAILESAVLDDATLLESSFARARADGISGKSLDLAGSTLDGASFRDAKLVTVRLYDCRARDARFDRSEMTNARVESVTFTDCSFRDIDAPESIWELADLTMSSFDGAVLTQASFVRTTCLEASFNEADLAGARLRKAKMKGATFLRANLFEAACDRASFELADLRGANLHGAFFFRASLRYAKADPGVQLRT